MSITSLRAMSCLLGVALAGASGCGNKQERAAQPSTAPGTGQATTPSDLPGDLPEDQVAPGDGPMAIARLQAAEGEQVTGSVAFVPLEGQLQIYVDITGLSPGLHGFHVHERGDCSAPDFSSAGAHFAPRDHAHGDPYTGEHHAGDLGNLEANEEGNVSVRLPAPELTIEKGAETSVLGKAIIVHAGADDLRTQPSGNSGARVACGVIELYQPEPDPEQAPEPHAQ